MSERIREDAEKLPTAGSGENKPNRRKTGTAYEEIAARYLTGRGYRILEHSFRCRMGEIDLIAVDPGIHSGTADRFMIADDPVEIQRESGGAEFPQDGCLVFVEVKYRKTAGSGHPEEAVSFRKQMAISRVADYYRVRKGISMELPCRFDVIAIEGNRLRHWKNAFPYAGC